MQGIRRYLAEQKQRGLGTIVGYLPGLFPDSVVFRLAVRELVRNNIRIVEVGVPGGAQDMDGAIIASALASVRRHGHDARSVIQEAVAIAIDEGALPIVMGFRVVMEELGVAGFLKMSAESNAAAILVPDADEHEKAVIATILNDLDLGTVCFLPANTPLRTLHQSIVIAYIQTAEVSTGGDFKPDLKLAERIEAVRRDSNGRIPVALGFGIKSADHIRQVFSLGADIAVVGTALVEALAADLETFSRYVQSISSAGQTRRVSS